METEIIRTIRHHMHGKDRPSKHDMLCFIGMIQTTEATIDDFEAACGVELRKIVEVGLRDWNLEHRDE